MGLYMSLGLGEGGVGTCRAQGSIEGANTGG